MDRAAVEVVAMDGIDHGAHHAFAVDAFNSITFSNQLVADGVSAAFDQREVAGDDARR